MEKNQDAALVLVVDNIPTPYRIKLFNYISRNAPFRVNVLYLSKKGNEKLWAVEGSSFNYDYYFLRSIQVFLKAVDIRLQVSFGVLSLLYRKRPDTVVVGGYEQPGYWTCLLFCKVTRTPFVLWSGTTLISQRHQNIAISILKKIFIKSCTAYIAYGTKAGEYLIENGAGEKRIIYGYNTTDLRALKKCVLDIRSSEEFPGSRKSLQSPTFIYLGRLTRLKGVDLLLNAFLPFAHKGRFSVMIVGDGYERNKLERFCKENGLKDNVQFVGYVQESKLADYLALGDVLIFPTLQEVWGLVVNEALSAGLYVISSIYAGVTYDLINDRRCGVAFDPRDKKQFVSIIKDTIDNFHEIENDRKYRQEYAMKFSIENTGEDIINGLVSKVPSLAGDR